MYSRYVIGLIYWADTRSMVVGRWQVVKFRCTLKIVTSTCAGGQVGWLGMLWSLPRLPYTRRQCHAQLTDCTEAV